MAKKKETTQKEAVQKKDNLLIKWNTPETLNTRFASHMVVQTVEDYFKLSFFELKPEIHIVPMSNRPTEINAECVASVVVPPHKIIAIIEVLQKQLALYQKKQTLIEKMTSTESEQPL